MPAPFLSHVGGLEVESYFDPASATFSHLLIDSPSRQAMLIDPVLALEASTGRIDTQQADRILQRLQARELRLSAILETHLHADHISAADYLRSLTGARIAVSAAVPAVQKSLRRLYKLPPLSMQPFDLLMADGEQLNFGELQVQAWHTPGHTPACLSWLVLQEGRHSAAFVGDTLLAPDLGTGRCDFPGGDARQLYRSINRLLSLPPQTPLYFCHDYPPQERDAAWMTTVEEQRQCNLQVRDGISEDAYVALRQQRDATLAPPRQMQAALQLNLFAGRLPEPLSDGQRYMKVPLSLD
ncbi:MBL fold metallo-hydrolase [Paucibacter sp. KBW04]|uniref:MBL fold metallo-hydrolase n=1 Tax=Paucibacter sp. KBW04 TaxID=2153361 RepID=UPI000F57BA07|nr:MBL fold metallo-hydrolase [Paucibacter sp. KBW04]RQO57275.1 MBL fold metallo-hydrolase [Paucibacter sp. KBW04]